MARIIKEYNRLPSQLIADVKPLNELSGSQWAQSSKSVQTYNGAIANKRRQHGAAFPLSLAKHIISLFTRQGDVVLDPFLGVGTTSDACTLMNRRCIGFEVNKSFYDMAAAGVEDVDLKECDLPDPLPNHSLFNESSMSMLRHVGEDSVDLTLTSPPYGNLLHRVAAHFAGYTYSKNIYRDQGRKLTKPYSALEHDLGNLDWPAYLNAIEQLMGTLYSVARPGSYNVWVVRDFRDVERHVPYISVHSKISELMTRTGWVLTDIIIWNQTEQRKLVKLGGIKQRRFYFNIGHSYIIVARKNLKGERFTNIW